MNTFQPGQAKLYHDESSISQLTRGFRKVARPVALVPAIHELHRGHAALVEQARRIPGAIVVLACVDKPGSDGFSEVFVATAQGTGADAVFLADSAGLFPSGPRTVIRPSALLPGSDELEVTLIAKLLNISHCTHVLLSEHHYQTLLQVQQLVTDLSFDVKVLGSPAPREADGLALSAKNLLLNEEDREAALSISAALMAGAYAAGEGPQKVLSTAAEVLASQPQLRVHYVELRDLHLGSADPHGANRLLIKGEIGGVELTDNIAIDFASEEVTGIPRDNG